MSLDKAVLDSLVQWRRLVAMVARATKMVVPEAEVYVVGGAAEKRLTILSDIDVVIALPKELDYENAVELKAKIFEKAEELGLPPHAPVELHIVGPQSIRRFLVRGKALRIDVGS